MASEKPARAPEQNPAGARAAKAAAKAARSMPPALIAGMAFLAFFLHSFGFYDPDGWFLLATGREIAESGIPRENPFSYWDGMGIVVQQWLHDAYLWAAYRVGGFAGCEVAMALPIGLAVVGVWKLTGAFGDGRGSETARAMVAACALLLLTPYFSVRPTSWSMALVCATAIACAKGRRDARFYAALPPIGLLWANLQAALWPLGLAVAAAFLLPWGKEEAARGLKAWLSSRKWLMAAMAGMAAATLANPYGWQGSAYGLLSVGVAGYGGLILEMRSPIQTLGPVEAAGLAAVFPLLLAILAKRRGKLPPLPAAAILIAADAGFLLCMRNVWIYGLAFALCASACLPSEPEGAPERRRPLRRPRDLLMLSAAAGFAFALGMGISVNEAPPSAAQVEDGSLPTWSSAASELGPIAEAIGQWEEDNGRAPLLCLPVDFASSALEWLGVKVPYDLRPEIWDVAAFTGRPDLQPWHEFVDGKDGSYLDAEPWDLYVLPAESVQDAARERGLETICETEGYALMKPAGSPGND